MSEMKKSSYNGYTPARKEANERYMKNFVEVKVRMTPENALLCKNMLPKSGKA